MFWLVQHQCTNILKCYSMISYEHHLKFVLNKFKKTIVPESLPKQFLITIYKSFIRPHLDYGDIVYDRAFNELLNKNLECIQYNAAMAITEAI